MISRDLYEFLTNDLKCPYDGKVQGLGEAYTHLVVSQDSIPNDLSENVNGNFYQPNYVSVVAPKSDMYDDEIAQKILDQIIHKRPDGDNDVWDVYRKRYLRFNSKIRSEINVRGNSLSIDISDDEGNSYKYNTDNLQGYIDDLSNSIPWGQVGLDIVGISFDFTEYKFRNLSTAKKSKLAWETKKKIKKLKGKSNIKTSDLYKKTMPRVYKNVGRVLLVISMAGIAADVKSNRSIKGSNALDVAMLSVSVIPPYGWIAGIIYFGSDMLITGTTGNSIGDNLDSFLNDYTPFSNGILLDLDSTFNWVENKWNNFWDDINLPDLMY